MAGVVVAAVAEGVTPSAVVSAATSSAVGGSPSASVPPLNPAVLLQAIAVRPGEAATGTVALGVTDVASEAGPGDGEPASRRGLRLVARRCFNRLVGG